MIIHYCRMLLTRHYNQRPFDKTVCDALIINGDVIKPSKKVQNICDGGDNKHVLYYSCVFDAWHTVHSNELFAMSLTTETGSQMKVCVIYGIPFIRINCLWLGNTTETVR